MIKLDTLLGKNKSLKEACENLQTILGIGKTTAVILLAEIPDINAFKNARQLAAYAGLTPSQRFSGSSVKGKLRLSKLGARQLRKAMFFPAFVAKRYNEPIIGCQNSHSVTWQQPPQSPDWRGCQMSLW